MSEAKDPARKSETTRKVEECIRLLAEWQGERTDIPKATAIERLRLTDEQYGEVMSALSARGVIKETNSSEPFHEFDILPGAVETWDAIRSRDRVSRAVAWLRSSPWTVGPALLLLAVIAVVTGGNQLYDLLRHVGVLRESPPVTLAPIVLPCPASSPSPDIKVGKYGGQPIEFWEVKLYDKDPTEGDKASKALQRFKKQAVPVLVKALYSDDEETINRAATSLGEIGKDATDAIPNLERTKQAHLSLQHVIDDALKKIRR
ncbi:MAG TPA: hypothetical protein VE863_07030 [Pyrinomonadaceae bacterium]|jgi:hypothetical protein|nr:hypothetical protein [Pyrinomonadaceae bacterium]